MNKSNEKEYFRVFIGTYINNEGWFSNYLSFINSFEKTYEYKIRWVDSSNLHMTWKFLGDITLSRVSRVVNELNSSLNELKPMQLFFNSLELWPKNNSPRQIVFTASDLEDNIIKNYKILDKSLGNVGFDLEKRPFKPHITLGRFKIKEKLSESIILSPENLLESVNLKISNIAIIKSNLLPKGPVYEVLHSLQI